MRRASGGPRPTRLPRSCLEELKNSSGLPVFRLLVTMYGDMVRSNLWNYFYVFIGLFGLRRGSEGDLMLIRLGQVFIRVILAPSDEY